MKELDASLYLDRLFEVYRDIDRAYAASADYYGFSCDGCVDNCCRTVFYHYTLIEYFGLLEGFDRLPEGIKAESLARARSYLEVLKRSRGREESLDLMCPLNFDGLCKVYEHRPLICRIHGFPGVLHHPARGKQQFTGCKPFNETNRKELTHVLDRTPFYSRIVEIERGMRRQMDYMKRFRLTIAEMLVEGNL